MTNPINKIKQVNALKNGRGLQYLLNEIYKISGNPIAVYDIYYNLFAHTDRIVTDDPLWNELITTGSFSKATIDFFKSECFIDAVANTDDLVLMTSNKLKYNRINGKIFDKNNIRIANIIIVECNSSFEADVPEIIRAFCKILSREIQESEFYQNLSLTYQETLVCDLIEGNSIDRQLVTAKVADIYKHLKSYIYLAVVEFPKDEHLPNSLIQFRDLFTQMQKDFEYYIYSDYIIILLSTDNARFNIKNGLNKLTKLFKENNMRVGISSCFDNLYKLHKYYVEAIDALNYAAEANDNQRIFLYEDMPSKI